MQCTPHHIFQKKNGNGDVQKTRRSKTSRGSPLERKNNAAKTSVGRLSLQSRARFGNASATTKRRGKAKKRRTQAPDADDAGKSISTTHVVRATIAGNNFSISNKLKRNLKSISASTPMEMQITDMKQCAGFIEAWKNTELPIAAIRLGKGTLQG